MLGYLSRFARSYRGGNVRIANIIFTDCFNSGDIVSVNITCANGDISNDVKLHHVEFQDNVLSEDRMIIATGNSSCTNLTLHNVKLVNNTCSGGGCMSLSRVNTLTDLRIEENDVASNATDLQAVFISPLYSATTVANLSALSNRIRIFIVFNSTLSIADSFFHRNRASNSISTGFQAVGGGVLIANHSTINVQTTIFEENSGQNGGAIYVTGSNLSVVNCTFRRNSGRRESGGAIRGIEQSRVTIEATSFYNNNATQGGACYFSRTSVTIRNLIFRRNVATGCCGGAVYIAGGEINGEAMRFLKNSAGIAGGGLHCHFNRRVSLSNVLFQNNTGVSGCAIDAMTTTLELRPPCTFIEHQGSNYGGAISQTNSSSNILSCSFESSRSLYGGALSVWYSHAIVKACRFLNGNATSHGGAIYLFRNSTIDVSDTLFSGNCFSVTCIV